MLFSRGTWVALSVKYLPLNFSSDHDLREETTVLKTLRDQGLDVKQQKQKEHACPSRRENVEQALPKEMRL